MVKQCLNKLNSWWINYEIKKFKNGANILGDEGKDGNVKIKIFRFL